MQQELTVGTLLAELDEKPFQISVNYKRAQVMPKDLDKWNEIRVISEKCNDNCKGVEISALVDLLNRNKTVQCECHNHLLINELKYEKNTGLKRKFHPSQHMYGVISKYVMTPILFKFSNSNFDIQNNPIVSKFLDTLIKNRNKDNYLSNLVKQNDKSILEFDAICPMKNWKVIMPVRHKNCKHFQCYELLSLLENLNDIQQSGQGFKNQNCYIQGCQSNFDMRSEEGLLSDLVFDYELFNAINLGQSGIVTFILNNNKITDSFTYYGKDELISEFFHQQGEQQHQTEKDFQNTVLKKCQILLQLQNIDKAILDKIQTTKYADYQISMKDWITNKLVKYPGRCIKCDPKEHCSDIRSLVSIYYLTIKRWERNQEQQQQQKQFQCPLCKTELFSENVLKQPEKLFYFDFQLFEICNEERESILSEKLILKHEGRKRLMSELFTKSRVKKETFIQKENTFKLNSFYSQIDHKKRLVQPLVLMNCPTQKRIDFSELFEALEKAQFQISNGLTLCKCEKCISNPIKSLKGNVFYDELMVEVLHHINKEQEDSPFSFNFDTKKISYGLQLQQTQILNQYLQDNFYDMSQDIEYQNLFKPNENNIQFTKIQITNSFSDSVFTNKGISTKANDQTIKDINNNNLGIKFEKVQIINKLGNQNCIFEKQY